VPNRQAKQEKIHRQSIHPSHQILPFNRQTDWPSIKEEEKQEKEKRKVYLTPRKTNNSSVPISSPLSTPAARSTNAYCVR
jgi:hypothetical protein